MRCKEQYDEYSYYCNDVGRRGYADAEIEAVFAKYDADGDNGLNMNEQGRMQSDLENQKVLTSWPLNDVQCDVIQM